MEKKGLLEDLFDIYTQFFSYYVIYHSVVYNVKLYINYMYFFIAYCWYAVP